MRAERPDRPPARLGEPRPVRRASPLLVRRVRAQRARSDAAVRDEFDYVFDRGRRAVPDWRDHPYLRRILWDWYESHALSLPSNWLTEIEADCRRFFANIPWPPRDEGESLSVSECRKVLGSPEGEMSSADVAFLRDQLYVLGEIIVDGTQRRSP